MKTQTMLSVLAGLVMSASAMASTPASYDTKFNVSANVPDSATITDPGGRPITDMDVELTPAASGYMEAQTTALKLWNNDVTKLEVALTLDDSQSVTGDAFTLYSTQGGTLNDMTYKISTITAAGSQEFAASGDSKDYTLNANGTHGELPLMFKFVSDKKYDALGQGNYTGVVYANVNAKP
ncbi:hypothetical protein M988_2330 [Hafnia paralvei ATCC 29927]|jgi:hypothetical protein|uniref:Fimbrial protein n=2 Tax=Hafnia TaxID=568 RepID=A0A4S1DB80_9GAMM|nr:MULTISPECIES: hypothetical protein [Hafnia]AJQ98921.1 hypothetical protein F652_931 [Enterobacteriaceae bacterium bta3-1]EFV41451.1 hypothetical protein HMPREF0864_00891 [Enterobacteriaceae bacterium 9_2_54FAA]MDU1193010.1 hypothetical protein [Enterobacteriaceae bacterium]AMH19469.1 hypothetical protein AL518_16475 [Hafnia paralvei]EHM46944.1 hypothetical protein HMPREF0454_00813 [Hafnia alvei ATCC 51873]